MQLSIFPYGSLPFIVVTYVIFYHTLLKRICWFDIVSSHKVFMKYLAFISCNPI